MTAAPALIEKIIYHLQGVHIGANSFIQVCVPWQSNCGYLDQRMPFRFLFILQPEMQNAAFSACISELKTC